MVGKEIRRVSRGYHYFFVKPGRNVDAHKAAEKLMTIEKVKEVSITEGRYGFVVKADEEHDDTDATLGKIGGVVGGNAVKVVCHCQYVRRG